MERQINREKTTHHYSKKQHEEECNTAGVSQETWREERNQRFAFSHTQTILRKTNPDDTHQSLEVEPMATL